MKESEKNKNSKVEIDKNLKKYVGKNISEAKTVAFNESIEEIKNALSKYSKLRAH